ncbi:MAG TPA: hypothetical protein VFK04_04105 [Gemmatimonadaceae bacterium]|nr:hypothetical protein [Gemmatimonadaceae bacterium]
MVEAQASLLAALLQRVGYALWQAAECEDTLAHYVVTRVRSSRGIGEAGGCALLEQVRKKTFGSLLKELKKAGVLESDLEQRLGPLLDERNWLVHRAKRESRGVLNDLAKLDRLVARLDHLAEEATDLNQILAVRLEEYIVTAGVDRAMIDREAARLIAEWGYF